MNVMESIGKWHPCAMYNEVSRPKAVMPRRRTIDWRIADVSAWEAHRRTSGRYIGGGHDQSAPTEYPISVVNVHHTSGRTFVPIPLERLILICIMSQ
jgi:hypothetical protein